MDTATGLREWCVVFQDRPDHAPRQWFHRFIPAKIAHVWAYAWDPATGIYLTIDARGNHLFIQPVPVAAHPQDVMLEIATRPGVRAIVSYVKPETMPFTWTGHLLYTCVSVVKDMLGMNARHVITPRQLFKCLTAAGGKILFQDGVL